MQIMIAASVAVLVLVFLLLPFFFGKGGRLEAASYIDSNDELHRIKDQLIARYLADEQAASGQWISAREWARRRRFILNRYVDAARRLDYVTYVQKLNKAKPQ